MLVRSIVTISLYTMGSRVFGFVRTVLMAIFVGSGAMADALVIAIKIPSVLRRIFAEGAFNAAFVPVFSGVLAKDGQPAARKLGEQIFTLLVLILIVLIVLVEIFTPQFLSVVVNGFEKGSQRFDYAITFTRLTFPFILFISVCALYGGILNSLERFSFAASSPMIGNIGIVLFVLACKPVTSNSGLVFASAISICGLLQAAWVCLPAAKHGYFLKLRRVCFDGDVRKFFRLLLPAALGAGVVQLNIFLDMIIASYLPVGGISYLEYADRINQLPLSTIGVAMGTALLPTLTRLLRLAKNQEANRVQNLGLQIALLMAVPAMVGLITLAEPIIRVVYTHGRLTQVQGVNIAHTLQAFALGLPAYILTKVSTSIFYAHEDTKTPVKVGTVTTLLNLALSITLMQFWQYVGIALATAITGWMNALALLVILIKKDRFQYDHSLKSYFIKITVTGAALGLVLEILTHRFWPEVPGEKLNELWILAGLIITGIAFYAGLAYYFKLYDKKGFSALKRP